MNFPDFLIPIVTVILVFAFSTAGAYARKSPLWPRLRKWFWIALAVAAAVGFVWGGLRPLAYALLQREDAAAKILAVLFAVLMFFLAVGAFWIVWELRKALAAALIVFVFGGIGFALGGGIGMLFGGILALAVIISDSKK